LEEVFSRWERGYEAYERGAGVDERLLEEKVDEKALTGVL
jgi:hypothetical protein